MNRPDLSRTLLHLTGADAATFLQGIITQDVLSMTPGETRFSALLSPQGKWLFDFFIHQQSPTHFLLDVRKDAAPRLLKGLNFYKLRANIAIEEATDARLYYLPSNALQGWQDPRHAGLFKRLWRPEGTATIEGSLPPEHYTKTRLALAIPEGGIDVTEHETAMDVSYDCLGAIHFTKGCYIGQEVTARMHYKAIARKGIYAVTLYEGAADTICPTPIYAAGKLVGELRSAQGAYGIAFARFDAVKDAQDKKIALVVDNGTELKLTSPDWQEKKYRRFLENAQPAA